MKFGNLVNPSSVDVKQSRGTSVAEEDSIYVFWDATLFRFVSGFRRFEASSSSHPTRQRHITTTSHLALLNTVVKLILGSQQQLQSGVLLTSFSI
jgi:ribosomal protein L27